MDDTTITLDRFEWATVLACIASEISNGCAFPVLESAKAKLDQIEISKPHSVTVKGE